MRAWGIYAPPDGIPGSGRSPPFGLASSGRTTPDASPPGLAAPASDGQTPDRRWWAGSAHSNGDYVHAAPVVTALFFVSRP